MATKAEFARHMIDHVVDGVYAPSRAFNEAAAKGLTLAEMRLALSARRDEVTAVIARLDVLDAALVARGG